MSLTRRSKGKIAAIVAGTVAVCVLLAVITTRGCAGGMAMQEKTERFDATGIDNIAIDFPAGKLQVRKATDGEADIVVSERVASAAAAKNELECSIENGTLAISYRLNPLAWLPIYWFGSGQRELDVAVPSAVFDRLQDFKLHSASGESTVVGVMCQNADVSVSSGNATFDGMTVEQSTKLQLSSGRLKVDSTRLGSCKLRVSSGDADVGGAMESLDLSVASGQANVVCAGSDLSKANVELTSGKIVLQMPEDAGFDAAVDKLAGSFFCEFDASVRGETYTYGDDRTPIDIHITSGSMTLKPM